MCPACWLAMIVNGLMWFSGALGITSLYRWLKIKYYFCFCKECKCSKCKKRDNDKAN